MIYKKSQFLVAGLVFILGAGIFHSCGRPKPKPETTNAKEPITVESSVDIVYFLGRNQHRLIVEASHSSTLAKRYLDRQVLKEAAIRKDQYLSFLQRASSFVEATRKPSGLDAPCRGAYSVTVRIGSEIRSINGCRSNDQGELSRLVRDGEFLLYSKN